MNQERTTDYVRSNIRHVVPIIGKGRPANSSALCAATPRTVALPRCAESSVARARYRSMIQEACADGRKALSRRRSGHPRGAWGWRPGRRGDSGATTTLRMHGLVDTNNTPYGVDLARDVRHNVGGWRFVQKYQHRAAPSCALGIRQAGAVTKKRHARRRLPPAFRCRLCQIGKLFILRAGFRAQCSATKARAALCAILHYNHRPVSWQHPHMQALRDTRGISGPGPAKRRPFARQGRCSGGSQVPAAEEAPQPGTPVGAQCADRAVR